MLTPLFSTTGGVSDASSSCPGLPHDLRSENPPHLATYLKDNRDQGQKALVICSSHMNTHSPEEREQIICQLTPEKDLFDPPGIAREHKKIINAPESGSEF